MRGASPHRCTKTYSAPGSRCLPPPAPALTPQPGPPQGSVSPAPQEGLGPAAGSLSLAAQPQRRGSRPPFPAGDLAPLRPSPQPGPGPRPLGSARLRSPARHGVQPRRHRHWQRRHSGPRRAPLYGTGPHFRPAPLPPAAGSHHRVRLVGQSRAAAPAAQRVTLSPARRAPPRCVRAGGTGARFESPAWGDGDRPGLRCEGAGTAPAARGLAVGTSALEAGPRSGGWGQAWGCLGPGLGARPGLGPPGSGSKPWLLGSGRGPRASLRRIQESLHAPLPRVGVLLADHLGHSRREPALWYPESYPCLGTATADCPPQILQDPGPLGFPSFKALSSVSEREAPLPSTKPVPGGNEHRSGCV